MNMPQVRLEISSSVIYQNVADEVVLLNLDSQQYFGLNSVGADAWKLLAEHGTLDAVVQGMHKAYGSEETVLRNDLGNLLDQLMAAGLVGRVNPA
jgi:hypothetical protein